MPSLVNQGRVQGDQPPIDMDWLYPDPNTNLVINLMVVPANAGDSRLNHWELFWVVRGTPGDSKALRKISLEEARDGTHKRLNHLTYWGAVTKQISSTSRVHTAYKIPVGFINLDSRIRLEEIARETQVMSPYDNGRLWNCQDFTTAVLYKAVECGLFRREAVDAALHSASSA
ncbi:hypothetical protein PHLCEN_2v8395 [Hermanssonia centrifuga]|uniref:Uncharacterized protein n=1 Tax=Hermanssonia centrifuga TaxID=98765 RepID=A0A2R6NTP5_9APHY|nr:hypothetical protein PHLCEN_2v8395 [Hermanssonia centrifuga]